MNDRAKDAIAGAAKSACYYLRSIQVPIASSDPARPPVSQHLSPIRADLEFL